jgi:hypothetical protein
LPIPTVDGFRGLLEFTYPLILASGFGLLSNSKAELITTEMHPASARTTAKTGFKIPKAAKLKATMFQMNA